MSTRTRYLSELGTHALSEMAYSEGPDPYVADVALAPVNTASKYVPIFGRGGIGGRVQDKPDALIFTAPEAGADALTFEITSRNGTLLGYLRSDVELSTIRSCDFTIGTQGCEDGAFVLGEIPSFPLVEFARVRIKFGNTDFYWYSGTLRRTPVAGATKDGSFKFIMEPMRKQLDEIAVDSQITASQDIGAIVETLVSDTISLYTNIGYNPAKIDNVTGVLTASTLDLAKWPLNKLLDTLADMAGAYWGVDGDGDFFFYLKADKMIQKSLFVGRDMTSFTPELNIDGVKNSIVVRRQTGRGSGGVGWVVSAVFDDDTSIATWGFRELIKTVPGYFSQTDCAIVGENALEELKDPQLKASSDGHIIQTGTDYIGPDRYVIVSDPVTYEVETDIEESIDDWVKDGAGDAVLSINTATLISGAGAVKLLYTSAVNDSISKACTIKGQNQELRFFVRSTRPGQVLTVGIGAANWDENLYAVTVVHPNTYELVTIDISALNLDSIGEIGFRIDDTNTTQNAKSIYIDRVSVMQYDFRHFDMTATRIQYTFAPGELTAKADWGNIPTKMESYVASLFEQAKEADALSKVR